MLVGNEGRTGDILEDVGFGGVRGDVGRGVCGDGFVFSGQLGELVNATIRRWRF